jgi:hypothetical protein
MSKATESKVDDIDVSSDSELEDFEEIEEREELGLSNEGLETDTDSPRSSLIVLQPERKLNSDSDSDSNALCCACKNNPIIISNNNSSSQIFTPAEDRYIINCLTHFPVFYKNMAQNSFLIDFGCEDYLNEAIQLVWDANQLHINSQTIPISEWNLFEEYYSINLYNHLIGKYIKETANKIRLEIAQTMRETLGSSIQSELMIHHVSDDVSKKVCSSLHLDLYVNAYTDTIYDLFKAHLRQLLD